MTDRLAADTWLTPDPNLSAKELHWEISRHDQTNVSPLIESDVLKAIAVADTKMLPGALKTTQVFRNHPQGK